MSYDLIKTDISLEEMILDICNRNNIKKLNFIVYQIFAPSSSPDFCPEEDPLPEPITEFEIDVNDNLNFDYLYQTYIAKEGDIDTLRKKWNYTTGICSRVNGKHLVLMDFDVEHMEEGPAELNMENPKHNVKIISDLIFKLNPFEGYIVQTDNSYHYYGLNLVPDKQFYYYLECAKEYDEIGIFWPIFQQRREYSVLRVTESLIKRKPKVIANIKPNLQ